jgi:hypothetical protein
MQPMLAALLLLAPLPAFGGTLGEDYLAARHRYIVPTQHAAGQQAAPSAKSTDALMAKYPAGAPYKGKPAAVDLFSHKDARTYRTVLREKAQEGPNFAGHMTVVEIGCGSSCVMVLLVDARDGRVHLGPDVFPTIGVEYRLDSRLLVTNPPEAVSKYEGPAYRSQTAYYLWSNGRLTEVKP